MPSRVEDLDIDGPPSINPYEVLSIEKDATTDQIKSAYRKAALKWHPDKAKSEDKNTAHIKFQEVAFAYAILSDEQRRKRYDTTGRTEESIDPDDDDFDWASFYREQFTDVITPEAIAKFAAEYKGSEEEKEALLAAYTDAEGDMDAVYEEVMLSEPAADDERFRKIIDEAIKNGQSRKARITKAGKEAKEAEELAKELGVHDKLNKKGKGKKGDVEDEGALAALIRQRQKGRANDFLANLEAKYAPKGGKRAPPSDEPPEEAFQKTEARRTKKSKKETPASDESVGARRSRRAKA
ncbi:hypothetical protein H2203_000940 [Taxawa tesnikishii (nom. ined.)]|nr:hypothetical protein H2203_000940 [Dothideales sp. JES 119]